MKEMIYTNSFKRWSFFVIGMIATIAYRVIIFAGEVWANVLWYVGTIGFVLYFWHRAEVDKKRANLVRENGLIDVVSDLKKIKKEQKQALIYLVKTSLTSKSRWNSLIIFWLSLLALGVGIVYDFILV